MDYYRVGNSELRISQFSMGADQASRIVTNDEKKAFCEAVDRAIELGVNLFDTAESYGNGKSEEILGEIVKGKRDKVYIASKVSRENWRYDDVLKACEGSLKRLGTDYLDIYYIHIPSKEMKIEETMKGLGKLKQDGKIRSIGLSNFSKEQIEEAINWAPVDILQSGYNPLWRKLEKDIIPFCIKNNISVSPYSPLAHGLLSGKFRPDFKLDQLDFRKRIILFRSEWFPKCSEIIEKMQVIAKKYEKTLAQFTLAWIAMQSGITSVLFGGRNKEQIEENLGAGDIVISEDDNINVRNISDSLLHELPDWSSIWFEGF